MKIKSMIRKKGNTLLLSKFTAHLASKFEVLIEKSHTQKLVETLNRYHVQYVFDVGACWGEYAIFLRQGGYKNHIISFEPTKQAYEKLLLHKQAKEDPLWTHYNIALGEKEELKKIHVTDNLYASSILLPCETLQQSHTTEETSIATLDSFFEKHNPNCLPSFVKIDTQGYELNILKGMKCCIHSIPLIHLEVSFKQLYEGSPSYLEILSFMDDNGFKPIDLLAHSPDPKSGEFMQADILFHQE